MSWKPASTVRRGMFGKVPLDGNSLGIYPTRGRTAILTSVLPVKSCGSLNLVARLQRRPQKR